MSAKPIILPRRGRLAAGIAGQSSRQRRAAIKLSTGQIAAAHRAEVTCDVHPAGRGQLYRHAGVEAAVSCGGPPRRLCRAGSIPRIKRVSFRGGPRWRCNTRKKDERRTAPQNRQTSAAGSRRVSTCDVSHFDGAMTGPRSILWDDRPGQSGQVRTQFGCANSRFDEINSRLGRRKFPLAMPREFTHK